MEIEQPLFDYGQKVLVIDTKKKTINTKEINKVTIKKDYTQLTTYHFKDGSTASPDEVFGNIDDVFKVIHTHMNKVYSDYKVAKVVHYRDEFLPFTECFE